MPNSPVPAQIASWMQANPWSGWIAFAVVTLATIATNLSHFVSSVDIFWAKVFKPWARKSKFKRLTKLVIKADIRGHVNMAVRHLRTQLPRGWINEIDIEWVERETKDDFFRDDDLVVRVRPYENQSRNFVTVTYYFLRKSFFPQVKKLIPPSQREAAVLQICARISEIRGSDAKEAFIQHVFEPAVDRKNRVINYFHRYQSLDEMGLFTGPLLREVQHIAKELQMKPERVKVNEELNDALKHLEEFSRKYKEIGAKIEDDLWSRAGLASKYALLLVAHPQKAALADGVRVYINRARENFDKGIERLYVLGTREQKDFAQKVISAIQSQTDYRLDEQFELYKDYRGVPGGPAALFVKP